MNTSGMLLLTDIDSQWYYNRFENGHKLSHERRILLNPRKEDVKSKGRPKGARGVAKKLRSRGHGESSTWRDPSMHKHETFDLPSSTAPANLPTIAPPPVKSLKTNASTTAALPPLRASPSTSATAEIDLEEVQQSNITTRRKTTTIIALSHGAGGEEDFYESGTLRERAYLRSIPSSRLGTHVEVRMLDDKDGEYD